MRNILETSEVFIVNLKVPSGKFLQRILLSMISPKSTLIAIDLFYAIGVLASLFLHQLV